jgi:hypothetical protein
MATLADMKARVADELARGDLTSQIASAIADAIAFYQDKRFFFNESRDITFSTVVGQQWYGAADNPNIPGLYFIDYLTMTVGNVVSDVPRMQPEDLEILTMTGTQQGEPYAYTYYNEQIRLYPVPSQVWPMRLGAHIAVAAPAGDGEAGNPWMTVAEKLIRSRTKYELAINWLKDTDLAQTMTAAVTEAFDELKGRTNRQTGRGVIRAMQF